MNSRTSAALERTEIGRLANVSRSLATNGFAGVVGFVISLPLHVYGQAPAVKKRPNIVLFLADDLGWTDLSCQGSKYYRTPALDRLAAAGVRFTNAYSACTVCSPNPDNWCTRR